MCAAFHPDAVETIPGLLVTDLASGSEMSRVYELMAENGTLWTALSEACIDRDAALSACAEVRGQLRESKRLVELLQAKVARLEARA